MAIMLKTFSFLTKLINAHAELKESKQLEENILDIDSRVIKSLYEPAIADGCFYIHPEKIAWINDVYSERADDLIGSIEVLSSHYWTINPPLSAALHAIWDSSQLLIIRRRSFVKIIFGSKKKEIELFLDIRALIVSAAIRYTNIKLAPIEISNPHYKFDEYKRLADMTVLNLSNVHKKI